MNTTAITQLWQGRATAIPRVFDRLALLSLIANLYFFQIWGLVPGAFSASPAMEAVRYILIAVSVVGVVMPWLHGVMLLNAGAFAAYYIANSPVASNNQTTAFFVCLVVLAAAAWLTLRPKSDDRASFREDVFAAISGPGRWLLAVMYFYGIYHKLNTDFLNPAVSCAVTLYQPLMKPFGLADWQLGHYGAIYATFIVEAIAMIALFLPRWKKWGMLIGIPFHVAIGWTGYEYYKDFCTIVLLMYAMFLPREALGNAADAAVKWAGSPERAARIGRWLLVACVGAYLVISGAVFDIKRLAPTHAGFVFAFTLYAAAFYAFVIAFVPWKQKSEDLPLISRPAWLMAVPVLFLLNGASPYFGLKTESSIAMYSNLHTEGGVTNHLIGGVLPFGAHYQSDIVRPISSNSPAFDRKHVGPGKALVRYEFDRLLAIDPNLQVTFAHNGEVLTSGPGWRNSYRAASWSERLFLRFKPVEFAAPRVCSH